MHIIDENLTTTGNAHSKTVDMLVDYITDCEFDESCLNTASLAMAMEYCYQPHPRFWREFSATFVADAVARLFPDRISAPGKATRSGNELMRDVREILRVNAFDEENAEMIAAVPVRERPADRVAASEWICGEYRRKRQMSELEFAQRDGKCCGEGALTVLECLEKARAGIPFTRIGTRVARSYRDAMLDARR
ncbi:hypothetical protein [Paraburkholderia aspalathi]|uniref:Uncharacterized protein n=1 Tax=Paraburkholderia aspalathi TaxID=1324617 RepID=A0A1I7EAQ8_9BURK|nr:hypothetical protein [Paraburkholderia aspalathi]SFU21024.1 hypothetical protein SAMN05192563_1015169 [Paraburkholderia aspalathi]